jgi:hypothetical protein
VDDDRTLQDRSMDDWDEYDDEPGVCWHYHGEGYGVVGDDWDSDDPINGPYEGEVQRCPCCNGSGKAEDCTFW